MRILHVTPWLAQRYGGPAILVPQVAVALTERGHDIQIVTTNVDAGAVLDVPTGERVDWAGASATFHPVSTPRWFITSWPLLLDLWRRVPTYDVVHIHYLYRFHGLAAAAAARSAGVPYIVQAHGALDPWNRGRKRRPKDVYHFVVEDRVIDGASAILCTSRQEEQSVRHLGYRIPTFVIPNGVDLETLRRPERIGILPSVAIKDHARIVTFLGRISKMKGLDLLVESFGATAAMFPDAHLIIAGPDDKGMTDRLSEQVAHARLAGRVSFIGPVGEREKRALLQRSSVLVLPSPGESFGLAAAEAMAVGCPVVVTSRVAIKDIVQASGAGLVTDRDPAELARAVATILSDPATAKTMGDAGQSVAERHFAWPVVASEMSAMYAAVAAAHGHRLQRQHAAPRQSIGSTDMKATIVCPLCRGALRAGGHEQVCADCARVYEVVSGTPILLPDPALAEHDELDHHAAHLHKASQAMHFDQAGEEIFETHRPHSSPRLYRFLIGEKIRRAVAPIRTYLANGASALVVCGGSGMDAEYLARAGADVITSDVSLGAALRARTRSARYGLGLRSIVADVELLPFPDQAIDLVAVHDGLHHLDDPYIGLGEMARVASRWVVVTEPARAGVTRLAIRLGLALEREEAGNRVARLDPSEVAAFLEAHGFAVLRAERYAMYYPHHPGRLFRFLSAIPIYPVVRVAWGAANALLGRFGNKMVVVAERVEPAADAAP